MNDNIGGIKSPKLASVKDIASMKLFHNSCSIVLKDAKEWIALPSGRYGTSVIVNPEVSDAGIHYSITAIIQIPRQKMNDELLILCKQLVKGGVIMTYKIFSNETFVIGTTSFPLKGKIEIIQAQNPSGFSGYKISLTGKQTIPQQTLEEI